MKTENEVKQGLAILKRKTGSFMVGKARERAAIAIQVLEWVLDGKNKEGL